MKEEYKVYVDHVQKGMDYEEIRTLAKLNGLKKEELTGLMRTLDDLILQRDEEKATQRQGQEWMWIGIGFCLIAAIMVLYSFFDPDSFYIYLVYGIFIGGFLVFWTGWQTKRNANQPEEED